MLMKDYYLYIKAGLAIDQTTEFFKVGVGQSAREQRLREILTAYAHMNGHFFVLWSMTTAEFYARIAESLGLDLYHIKLVSAAQLVARLNVAGEYCASVEAERNRHRLLMQVDPDYYTAVMLRKRMSNTKK